ncbi:DUF6817 domain-containing protein [Nocardia sp. NPDC057663]|uniref:DUF6817 domain-containing protein n=1 Tax=Nocardia sp. NPDC057663 TaxID=3346201 RepID=UPI00366D6CC0
MTDDANIQLWLAAHGADMITHPGGTLLDHLNRVAARLADWNAPNDLRLAGLCHATYGTDGFATALLTPDERPQLAELIGSRAENYVYLYGSCTRSSLYPQLAGGEPITVADRFTGSTHHLTDADTRALLEITAANEIDVMLHNEDLARLHAGPLYELLAGARHLLSDAAWADCAMLHT